MREREVKSYKWASLKKSAPKNAVLYVLNVQKGGIEAFITDDLGNPIPLITKGSTSGNIGDIDIRDYVEVGPDNIVKVRDNKIYVKKMYPGDDFITIEETNNRYVIKLNDDKLELVENKQNDLTPDGTGTKYPTVDAVNIAISDIRQELGAVAFSNNYEDLDNLPTIPAQVNLIEGSNITITGTYPNLTLSASGTVGTNWDGIRGDQSDINISGFTNDAGYITASSLPNVGNGDITYSGIGDITGGGTSTANQSGDTDYTFDLTAQTKSNIALGVTAHGWGNHALAGYLVSSDLNGYATETWVTQQINNISIPTVNDGQLTLTTGAGLSGSANFTANQSGNSSFSVSVASTHKLPTVAEWNALPTTYTGSNGIDLVGTDFRLSTSTLASLALAYTAVQPSALNGYVPTSRTITINGTTLDLSQNRSWTILNNDTITRLRGTSTGTYTSGDLTLLAGSNVSITQSGSNFTINATDTNTTYTAGIGLSLTGTTFGQKITTNGTGTFVTGITQTADGFQVNLGTPPNTTYSAGSGLTLSGTTFSLPITYSGSGDYIANIVQNTNGLTVTRATLPTFNDAITSISRNGVNIPIVSKNVDIPIFSTTGAGLVPPRVGSVATKYLREDGTWVTPTNTTYSAGTLALLEEGTNPTNMVWSSKVLADGVIRKGVHNVNPAGQPFSIEANNGRLTLDEGGRFRFEEFGDQDCFFEFRHDEGPGLVVGHNHIDYEGTLAMGHLRFYGNGVVNTLSHNLNGYSRTRLPVTGSAEERVLAVGATMGGSTYYANDNGLIELPDYATYTAGTGISIASNVITNTAPNATHTGDVTGATYLTIANNAVTNTKMALMNANSIKGRAGSIGNPQDLTPTQVRTMLNVQEGANRTRIGINGGNYSEVGDINLIAGSNVSLSKSGGNITINSTSQPIDTTVKLYMPGEVVNNDTISCNSSKTIIYLEPTFAGPLNIAIEPELQDGAELNVIHTYEGSDPGLFNINGSLIDITAQLTSSHLASQGKRYRFIYVKDLGRFALVDGGSI